MPLSRNPVNSAVTERIEATPHFKILHPLVNSQTASTVADSLQQISDITSERLASKVPRDLDNHLWDTFCAVLELAARTQPPHQSKLVDFIVQIRGVKVKEPRTGEVVKHEAGYVWEDLPSLGYCVTDTDVWDPDLKPEQAQRWENTNAFLAQLPNTPLDWSLRGLWAFRTAFEGGHKADSEPNEVVTVRAACWWFIYATDKLWPMVVEGKVYEGRKGAAGIKYAEKEWKGYNRERWAVWEQSLKESKISKDDTKKLIEDALAAITKATGV